MYRGAARCREIRRVARKEGVDWEMYSVSHESGIRILCVSLIHGDTRMHTASNYRRVVGFIL